VTWQVSIRKRPLLSKELEKNDFETVKILDGKVVVLMDPGNIFEANDVRLR
jgi:hypothetical protein